MHNPMTTCRRFMTEYAEEIPKTDAFRTSPAAIEKKTSLCNLTTQSASFRCFVLQLQSCSIIPSVSNLRCIHNRVPWTLPPPAALRLRGRQVSVKVGLRRSALPASVWNTIRHGVVAPERFSVIRARRGILSSAAL